MCSLSFRRNWHSCWNRCVSGGFAIETMLFEHKFCRQSFSLKVVGWNGTDCLLSSWVLVVKNVQHRQHHAEYQQPTCVAQCSFHNVDSVQVGEIDTEVYQLVANKYSRLCWPKVPLRLWWYGTNLLVFLWILVRSALRIWICLDLFFLIHFTTNTSSTMQPCRIPAIAFACFHHVCSCMGTMDSVLVSNMLK